MDSQPNKKYVFITGAPGSRWGRLEYMLRDQTSIVDDSAWMPFLQDQPKNLTAHVHKFFGPYQQHGERFDVLHILGRNGIYDELDRAFDSNNTSRIRFVRCHWFAYQLDWIKENLPEVDILMMFRESNMCYEWWHRSGGWDIQYPSYKWYGDSEMMRRQIIIENECMIKFMREQRLKMNYCMSQANLWIQTNWPEWIPYLEPDKDWYGEWSAKNQQSMLGDESGNDLTLWPVLYRGSHSCKF